LETVLFLDYNHVFRIIHTLRIGCFNINLFVFTFFAWIYFGPYWYCHSPICFLPYTSCNEAVCFLQNNCDVHLKQSVNHIESTPMTVSWGLHRSCSTMTLVSSVHMAIFKVYILLIHFFTRINNCFITKFNNWDFLSLGEENCDSCFNVD
jgi:hypothetical protein